ncbi:hypothetical protein [Actinoplanes sp. G11-F43]
MRTAAGPLFGLAYGDALTQAPGRHFVDWLTNPAEVPVVTAMHAQRRE